MSWSASFTVTPGVTPEEEDFVLSNVNEVPEHLEQFREAVASTFGILLSGVLGSQKKSFRVNLTGHGNPDHEPAKGWASEFLTISITQVGEPS
jgi:hypothetical protein